MAPARESLSRLDACGRARRNRRQNADPVANPRGAFSAAHPNHAAAGIAGVLFGSLISGDWMRWLLGLSFVGVAVWALFPDSYEESPQRIGRFGAFTATLVAFFLAEIGDKTQIATIGVAARFGQLYPVVLGTT